MLLIIPDTKLNQHKAGLTAILIDRDTVDTVQQSLDHIFVNIINLCPDTGNSEIVNIATGAITSKSICKDLTHVKEIGEKAMKTRLDTGGKYHRLLC